MLFRGLLLVLAVHLLDATNGPFKIQTTAGTDYVGDGAAATSAILSQPEGIAIDANGNVYVADADDNRIREISPRGVIETIAGTGVAGFSGDGGPAAAAQVDHPYGLALDSEGNLYIADLGNARVRKLTTDGNIATVAGGEATAIQLNAPRNVALDGAGNLYIADFGANQVYEMAPGGIFSIVAGTGSAGYTGDGGPALQAQLTAPAGLAVDTSGNLYIADSGNNCVREVSDGGITTVFSITGPTGLALNASGTLYVAASGYFGTIARSIGPGLVAQDVTADAEGNLYLTAGTFVEELLASNASVIILAGNGAARYYGGDGGPAINARLHSPSGVVIDDLGNVFIADTQNNRIREILANGTMTTFAGTGQAGSGDGQGSAMLAQFSAPSGVAIDSMRDIYVADSGNNRVCKITPGGTLSVVASQLANPRAVAVDSNGTLYIADTGNDRVVELTASGATTMVSGLSSPAGVAVDSSGTLYISESKRISKIATGGGVVTTVQDGLNSPSGLAILPSGNLVVAETGNQRVLLISQGAATPIAGTGAVGFSGDGGPALLAELNTPEGVALDGPGNIWIADSANNRMRMLTASISTELSNPITLENAASLESGPVAPGEIVTIFGSGFDPLQTQVLFGTAPATLFYTSANQINALIPTTLTPGSSSAMTIVVDSATVSTTQVTIAAAAPGLFASNGNGPAAALNGEGSVNSAANPALRGGYASLFATGWSGTATVTVTIAGYDSPVLYAGPAPGFSGLMQVNVQIPAGFLPPGAQPVTLTVGGVSSQTGVTLAVK